MRELGFSENVVLAMMREFDSSGPDALRVLPLGSGFLTFAAPLLCTRGCGSLMARGYVRLSL